MECQQEAEAAHPAPAWGRWKWNASMKWKLPLRHCTVGSMGLGDRPPESLAACVCGPPVLDVRGVSGNLLGVMV